MGESATIGMPDDRLGERISWRLLGDSADRRSVTAYLEGEGVPKRLWPERIEIIDEIPKTLAHERCAATSSHRRARGSHGPTQPARQAGDVIGHSYECPLSYYDHFDTVVCMIVTTRFVAAWGR